MLAPEGPPATQIGAVKWLRENLFSGPLNTLLTLAGLTTIAYLLNLALPWFLHSVWNAKTFSECREIVANTWGPDAHGACWAMIRERWNQFLFGFYPNDLYWRPVLTFLLLFVAIVPVLFREWTPRLMVAGGVVGALILWLSVAYGDAIPAGILVVILVVAGLLGRSGRKYPATLSWFTLIFPVLALWLLWGGSIWMSVAILLGFVLGGLAFRLVSPAGGLVFGATAAVLVPILWWYYGSEPFALALDRITGHGKPFWLREVRSDDFGGFVLAFVIGVSGIAASLPLGIILALGRKSDMLLVKWICVGFIEFIRGVPLITLLFTASLLLNYFLPPGTNFNIILRVIIMVTFFSAAYIAEVIRGGLAALPRGQYEAADALGLDYWKAQRLIIMPQALKISIPGIVSSFIGLFKDTTLVVFVALLDPLKGITDAVRASLDWKGIYWEPYIFVGCIFFVICFSMSRYSMHLERLLKREHR
ncbi:amino acid ABC transporter permease [Albidovulum sp.]|uniref:amino acid ABC transporter permease n=1 Tax=Albidovulum sp. TaxID=1872424 RepID=UPI0035276D5C